jgi:hypothetical protein
MTLHDIAIHLIDRAQNDLQGRYTIWQNSDGEYHTTENAYDVILGPTIGPSGQPWDGESATKDAQVAIRYTVLPEHSVDVDADELAEELADRFSEAKDQKIERILYRDDIEDA